MARDRDVRRPFTISLRLKITVSFFFVSALVSVLLSMLSYELLADTLTRELKERLKNIAYLGAASLDTEAFARLSARAGKHLDEDERDEVEDSGAYRKISEQLNRIRDTAPALIRYVYTFRPGKSAGKPVYVVDADALEDIEKQAQGKPHDEISHFGSEYDIAPFPEGQTAVNKGLLLVESEFRYDAPYNVYSVTGYAPIYDANQEYLGALCIDMADTDVRKALARARDLAIMVGVGALVLSLVAALFIGSLLTRAILSLDAVVRRFGDRDFSVRSHVHTHDEVGNLSINFNNMAQIIQDYSARLESLLAAYGKFVPHDLLKLLDKESILDVRLGDQVQRDMTVLFSDIRSFTTLSESMTPRENFEFINSYLRNVGPVIRQNSGIIDKYIGDAVMALFPRSAADALNAGIDMFRRVEEYNHGRRRAGYVPVSIGVGVHTGKLMLGTVGEEERMDGTVISDAVNLASRLEGLTKYYGARLITTSYTLRSAGHPGLYAARFLDRVQVKGKNEPVEIFELLNADSEDAKQRKVDTLGAWERALAEYYGRNFDLAMNILGDIIRHNPEDAAAKLYAERCRLRSLEGVSADWTGIEKMTEK